MSTEITTSEGGAAAGTATTPVPKRIVNAQTVCNERNEKGKLCNGHIKQLLTGGEPSEVHLRGDDVLMKCQACGALYMGPPLGHVRDPRKQTRAVEEELAALLQAAGGTLPAFKKSPTGAWVPALEAEPAHAAPAAAAKPAAPTAKTDAATAAKPSAASAGHDTSVSTAYFSSVKPPASETPDQKRVRLARLSAQARLVYGKITREEFAEAMADTLKKSGGLPPGADTSPPPDAPPPAAAAVVTDSSPTADAHRPAAEAQAATGQASAAPLSPAAATASPVAGAETPDELAPDAVARSAEPSATTTQPAEAAPPAAPKRAAPARPSSGKDIPPPPAHLAPPAGETPEEKLARLRRVVEEAKARAGK